jgi:large subunit ribosomal protein L24
MKNPQGGEQKRVELQVPIHISNVMLWDNESNKSSRIGYKLIDTKKQRYFKKSGNIVA